MTSPSLQEFVSAAREFCALAEKGNGANDADMWEVRALLLRLVYHIPSVDLAPKGADFDGSWPDDVQYTKIVQRFSDFSFNYYRKVFDSHDFSAPDEPVAGLLSDDLADIYRDLSKGLDRADKGHFPEACFEWSFWYRSHWGRHAIDALAAIETYRIKNCLNIERTSPQG